MQKKWDRAFAGGEAPVPSAGAGPRARSRDRGRAYRPASLLLFKLDVNDVFGFLAFRDRRWGTTTHRGSSWARVRVRPGPAAVPADE